MIMDQAPEDNKVHNSENSEVLVVGESCKDIFTYGYATRLCPDVPAPVFKPVSDTEGMGMAGNVFLNLEGLGIECDILTNRRDCQKHRYVDIKTNHTLLRVDTNDDIPRVPDRWLKGYDLSKYKAIVVADYGKGFLEEEDIKYLCDNHDKVFLDTKKVLGDYCANVKFIKINKPEYDAIKDKINLEDWVEKLIVTLGDFGCTHLKVDLKSKYYFKSHPIEDPSDIIDLSGAGDSFQAGLVFKYLETEDIDQALNFANITANDAVRKKGVSVIKKEGENNEEVDKRQES